MKRFSHASLFAAGTLGTALLLNGCKRQEKAATPAKPPAPPHISQDILDKFHPDETGAVMVVMYHRFLADEPDSDLNRRPDTFRKDLETFYKKGYYPVNAIDFVTNKMDVPAGKTPIVLTFDDALPSQFNVIMKNGEAKIDPDCAVGIMETFHKNHPDWPMKGTFFVLPHEGRNGFTFGQADSVADKLNYLLTKGYEIGNHTSTHSSMRGMDATKVQWELGTAAHDIQAINKNVTMEVMAIPYGVPPHNKEARAKLLSGESGGTSYANKAVFLAAWRPDLSPITKTDKRFSNAGNFSLFDPAGLERITPDAKKPNEPGVLEYWLKYFDQHPRDRYISDGNLTIAAVPQSRKNAVDSARAKASGVQVQYYGGGKGGAKLSVE